MTWIAAALFAVHALAADPSATELLAEADKHMTFDSRSSTMSMTVDKTKRSKTYSMQSFSRGADETAIEFIEPVRDKGTKMLKKADELWMWLPAVERKQRISGHMLRKGLMGSDFSYEDLMEANDLSSLYDATVQGSESKDGYDCWKLELTAKDESITYTRRVMWLDKATAIPVRQELYALSGMMVKVWTMGDIQTIDGHNTALTMTAEDKLTGGSSTTITLSDVRYSVELPEEVFSQLWLER